MRRAFTGRVRAIALGMAALLAFPLAVTTAVADEPTTTSVDIPSLMEHSPWPVGIAVAEPEIEGEAKATVLKHFNQITAENAMKPAYIWWEPDVWNFESMDKFLDFAVENGLRVHAHTLLWHNQMADWFYQREDGTPFWDADTESCILATESDRELMRSRISTYIATVARHILSKYGDFGSESNPIVSFDVVNEALANTESNFYEVNNPLYCALGKDLPEGQDDYVAFALRVADQELRNEDGTRQVKLFLNDFNTEWNWLADNQLAMVKSLLARGVPLDGVGHQLHLSLNDAQSFLAEENLPATLKALDELGIEQAITELDVGINHLRGAEPTQEELNEQGEVYRKLFALFRQYDLFSVSVWGLTDSRSWRNMPHPEYPLLFTDSFEAKPALIGVLDQSPMISAQPVAKATATVGASITLNVAVNSYSQVTYSWQRRLPGQEKWSNISSSSNSSLTFPATMALNGSSYRVVVSNKRGSITSQVSSVTVSVDSTPTPTPTPTDSVGKSFLKKGTASIKGTVRYGSVLRASLSGHDKAASSFSFQWLRNGVAIKGATKVTYAPKAKDVGAKLSVRITLHAKGYQSLVLSASKAQTVVKAKTKVKVTKVRVKGKTVRVTVKVTVVGNKAKVKPVGKVRVRVAGKAVTVKLTAKHAGQRVVVVKNAKKSTAKARVVFQPGKAFAQSASITKSKIRVK